MTQAAHLLLAGITTCHSGRSTSSRVLKWVPTPAGFQCGGFTVEFRSFGHFKGGSRTSDTDQTTVPDFLEEVVSDEVW